MEHLGTNNLETDRLLLRKWKTDDANDVFCFFGDSSIVPYPYKDIEQTRNELESWIKGYENISTYEWGIELKDSNKIIGVIFAMDSNDENQSCKIAFTLSKSYWNNGYATEALYHVLRYLLNDVGYNRVQGGHFIDNPASGKVMEKAGMIYEGTMRQEYINWKTGKFIDHRIYGIIKDDLKN